MPAAIGIHPQVQIPNPTTKKPARAAVKTAPESDTSASVPVPHLVKPDRAAEILGRSPATLKRWRYEGIGPNYVDMEGRIRYDVQVLRDYIEKNTRVPSVRAAMEESRETV